MFGNCAALSRLTLWNNQLFKRLLGDPANIRQLLSFELPPPYLTPHSYFVPDRPTSRPCLLFCHIIVRYGLQLQIALPS